MAAPTFDTSYGSHKAPLREGKVVYTHPEGRFYIRITLLREKDHQIWTESLLAIVLILRWRKVTSCLPSRIAPRPCGRHTGKRIHLRKSGVKKWKP